MKRRGATLLISIIAALAMSALPASAAEILRISDPTPGHGQLVAMSGSGCVASSNVAARFDGTTLRNVTADGEGDFFVTIRIPNYTAIGTHTIGTRCLRAHPTGSALTLNKNITVHIGIT